jgi:hypothetical protein
MITPRARVTEAAGRKLSRVTPLSELPPLIPIPKRR